MLHTTVNRKNIKVKIHIEHELPKLHEVHYQTKKEYKESKQAQLSHNPQTYTHKEMGKHHIVE